MFRNHYSQVMLMYKPSRLRSYSTDFADRTALLGFSGATEGRDEAGRARPVLIGGGLSGSWQIRRMSR
jgi:hypothetical protein